MLQAVDILVVMGISELCVHIVDKGNPSFLNSSFLCRRFMLGQDIQYKHFHLQTKKVFGRQHYKSECIFFKGVWSSKVLHFILQITNTGNL